MSQSSLVRLVRLAASSHSSFAPSRTANFLAPSSRWSVGLLNLLVCMACLHCGLSECRAAPPAPLTPENAQATPLSAAETEASKRSSENDVKRWVIELSSTEYRTRREAFLNLWSQGADALPAVRLAMNDSDPQVAGAARILETLLQLRIRPEDNNELEQWLQISQGSLNQALRSLSQKGHWRLATDLLKINPQVVETFRADADSNLLCSIVQAAYEEGDANKAWPVLEQLLDPVQRSWMISKLGLEPSVPLDALSVDERALLLLYRGDIDAAWALSPSLLVKQRIIFLGARWNWLTDPLVERIFLGTPVESREGLAHRAAYAFLANDISKSNAILEQVREQLATPEAEPPAAPKPDPLGRRRLGFDTLERRQFEMIYSLLTCGDGVAAHALISKGKKLDQFNYFLSRQEYDVILEAYSLNRELEGFHEWLQKRVPARGPVPGNNSNDITFKQFCDLSAFLFAIGQQDKGMQLYKRLMELAQNSALSNREQYWDELAAPTRQPQLRSWLIAHLDEMGDDLPKEVRERLLSKLYDEWTPVASVLWQKAPLELAIRQPVPTFTSVAGVSTPAKVRSPRDDEPSSETADKPLPRRWALMERIWRYDRELIRNDEDARALEAWLIATYREGARMEENAPTFGKLLADLAIRLGLRRPAMTFLQSSAGLDLAPSLADAALESNQAESSHQWWEIAIAQEPREHEWILKDVTTLRLLGEDAKADKLAASLWLRPLGIGNREEGATYYKIAKAFNEEGDFENATMYADAAFKLYNEDDALGVIQASGVYCDILLETEQFQKLADVQRAANIGLYATVHNRGFQLPLATYSYFISQEMLARAAAELEAGQVESALDRIARYESMRPMGIEICEHTYGRLVKLGKQAEADAMLDRCRNRMLQHLENWPRDAGAHNNLAWMLARCNTRLQESLEHAELAVKLSDRTATYVDTLAEAQYRLGNASQAIALARECIATDPRHSHYRRQLARFQSGK